MIAPGEILTMKDFPRATIFGDDPKGSKSVVAIVVIRWGLQLLLGLKASRGKRTESTRSRSGSLRWTVVRFVEILHSDCAVQFTGVNFRPISGTFAFHSFGFSRNHHDAFDRFLLDHVPEIVDRTGQRSLRGDVRPRRALDRWTNVIGVDVIGDGIILQKDSRFVVR